MMFAVNFPDVRFSQTMEESIFSRLIWKKAPMICNGSPYLELDSAEI